MKTLQLMSVCSLVVAVALPGVARADRLLRLDEAFALARKQNLDLKAAQTRLDQAEANIIIATSALLPKLSTQLKYTRNYKEASLDLKSFNAPVLGLAGAIASTTDNGVEAAALNSFQTAINSANVKPIIIQKANQIDFGVNVSVPIIAPSQYYGYRSAKRNYESVQATFAATQQGALWGVAQAFYAAAGVDELVAARENAVKVADQTLQNAKARFDAGTVNRVEVTRAELALVRAQQAVTETLDIRSNAYQALATLLELNEPFKVDSSDFPTNSRQVDDLINVAQHDRPELLALSKAQTAANDAATSALLTLVPSVSGFGSVRAFNYQGFTGDKYAWLVGLELDWTLFDGGYAWGQRAANKAQAHQVELQLELQARTVTDEVRTAARAIPTKQKALEAAQRAVALSNETLALVRVQHEAGTATQLDLLQAQDALVSADVAVAQARFDLATSQAQLLKATGELGKKK